MMKTILIDWVKILNQFKVRNIQMRITFFKIALLFGFFYLTISISTPFWDFSYLLAFICFERGLDIQLKKHVDFAMIATTPFSLLNKFKLIFVQNLVGGGLIFFIFMNSNRQIVNSYWNIFLNPFTIPSDIHPIIWQNTILKSRLFLLIGAIVCLMIGFFNLQKRERFV